jgi:hypothetical protein
MWVLGIGTVKERFGCVRNEGHFRRNAVVSREFDQLDFSASANQKFGNAGIWSNSEQE